MHAALRRLRAAGLLGLGGEVNLSAAAEFLVHAVKYAFPPRRGELTRGVVTAFAAPPLNAHIAPGTEPHRCGRTPRARREASPSCRSPAMRTTTDSRRASVLGFTNRWYAEALAHATWVPLGTRDIRLITAPYFLATKFEAFQGRGHGDVRGSHDLEDIVVVIDGRRGGA